MIRDPSDGSVKEIEAEPAPVGPMPEPVKAEMSSGLPIEKATELDRLNRSREWLSKYRTNPESITRLMGQGDEG